MSYYDWELNFRKEGKKKEKIEKKERSNGIGIPKSKFKEFLKEWKNKNLT